MTKLDENQVKKLKALQQLALQTAKAAADVFGDALGGQPAPPPPKPKLGDQDQGNDKAGHGPVPPVPVPKNLEAISLIIEGGLSIAKGTGCLIPEY